jgi:hypothetical protein
MAALKTVRVAEGTIEVWIDDNGTCRVTWLPRERRPDGTLGGVTHGLGDDFLPNDFPDTNDPRDVETWAVARWGP